MGRKTFATLLACDLHYGKTVLVFLRAFFSAGQSFRHRLTFR
jgi:hypothetical protein